MNETDQIMAKLWAQKLVHEASSTKEFMNLFGYEPRDLTRWERLCATCDDWKWRIIYAWRALRGED